MYPPGNRKMKVAARPPVRLTTFDIFCTRTARAKLIENHKTLSTLSLVQRQSSILLEILHNLSSFITMLSRGVLGRKTELINIQCSSLECLRVKIKQGGKANMLLTSDQFRRKFDLESSQAHPTCLCLCYIYIYIYNIYIVEPFNVDMSSVEWSPYFKGELK